MSRFQVQSGGYIVVVSDARQKREFLTLCTKIGGVFIAGGPEINPPELLDFRRQLMMLRFF